MKRVLLTGASGFVGRHAIPALARAGFEVHAAGRTIPKSEPGTTWHATDLLDPAQRSGLLATVAPTHLLHLAWDVTPGVFRTAPDNRRWSDASLDLLRRFVAGGGRRAVLAGSCAEYQQTSGRCDETSTPIAPTTLYGECKAALGSAVTALASSDQVSAAWGRIFHLYGPHERPGRLVADTALALVRGEPARCTAGLQRRDYLYVEDVADAFVALLDSAVTGPVNIGSGRAIPVRELISALAAALDRPDLVQFGAIPMPEHEPPLIEAAVTRLRDEVGWRPRVMLADGIARTAAYWREFAGVAGRTS